jgi:hypothetical protein
VKAEFGTVQNMAPKRRSPGMDLVWHDHRLLMSRIKRLSAAWVMAGACISATGAFATTIADNGLMDLDNAPPVARSGTDFGIIRIRGSLAEGEPAFDPAAGAGPAALRAAGDPTVLDLARMLAPPADFATADPVDALATAPAEETDATPSSLTDPYIRVAVPALAAGGLLVSGFLLRGLARRRRRRNQIRAAATLSQIPRSKTAQIARPAGGIPTPSRRRRSG